MAPNVLDTVLLPQPGKPAIVDGRPRCSQTKVTLETDYLQFFSRILIPLSVVRTGSFFTNHGRVLICFANDPRLRLRDVAAALDITERSTHGIVTDLADAGYTWSREERTSQPLSGSGAIAAAGIHQLGTDHRRRPGGPRRRRYRRPKEPKELRAL